MRYCPRVKTLIASWDFKPGFLSIVRMRCRQWDCPYCSTKNADMWRAHLLETFCNRFPDKHWVFVTLTVPPWAHELEPDVSLRLLKDAWNGMYDRMRFKNGKKLSYVLVFETHKSGIFHVHALCDMGIVYDDYGVSIDFTLPYDDRILAEKDHPFGVWLREKCTAERLGWVCHATRIREGVTGKDNARLAVGYITKYFSKAVNDVVLPKRARRICTSRDIGSPRTKGKKEFSWVLKGVITSQSTKIVPHWLVSEDRILGPSDFGDDDCYPSIE